MTKIVIKNGYVVNEGYYKKSDIFIQDGKIELIGENINKYADITIDATNKFVLPGVIDDHVHFREPGLEHKGTIHSESLAALYGGVTSFMDMPNTKPPVLTREILEKKYDIAAKDSFVNYSFYMGSSNDNVDEVLQIDNTKVCGVKLFLGSTTGNLVIDDPNVIEKLFRESPSLLAAHCEDDSIIKENSIKYKERFGEDIPTSYHPKIRPAEACYMSSEKAVAMAEKYNTKLHIMHISTAEEIQLFKTNHKSFRDKRVTAEVCVSYLLYSDQDYSVLGNKIKCNPAIKSSSDREALWNALFDDALDVIATDHAPHSIEEKNKKYLFAPSGIPMVQHGLYAMLDNVSLNRWSISKIVEKMCHNPADIFRIKDRGYIREGYWADLLVVDMETNNKWQVQKENIYYKCNWSPLEGKEFRSRIETVLVNGEPAILNGKLNPEIRGKRLEFEKER